MRWNLFLDIFTFLFDLIFFLEQNSKITCQWNKTISTFKQI